MGFCFDGVFGGWVYELIHQKNSILDDFLFCYNKHDKYIIKYDH